MATPAPPSLKPEPTRDRIMNAKETNELPASKADSTVARLPDFIVIGEMRCGSTTLWEMLDRHPAVAFPEEKELHFFDDRDGRWSRGVDWYADLFKHIAPDVSAGEATPDYLFHEGACERIAATVPGARLLVILRDPKERAWSHYWHNIRRGRETLGFDEAMKAEAGRMESPDVAVRSHFSYVTRGHYVRRLEHFARVFGRDSLRVIFLEELIAEPERCMREVCAHLGIDAVPEVLTCMPPQRNKADYPRWPALSALTRRMMKAVRTNPLLAGPAAAFAKATRPLRTYSGQTRMDPETRARLAELYRGSDVELGAWLGREVPWAAKSPKH